MRLPWPHAEPGSAELSPFTSPVPAIHSPSSVEKPVPLFDPVHLRLVSVYRHVPVYEYVAPAAVCTVKAVDSPDVRAVVKRS